MIKDGGEVKMERTPSEVACVLRSGRYTNQGDLFLSFKFFDVFEIYVDLKPIMWTNVGLTQLSQCQLLSVFLAIVCYPVLIWIS